MGEHSGASEYSDPIVTWSDGWDLVRWLDTPSRRTPAACHLAVRRPYGLPRRQGIASINLLKDDPVAVKFSSVEHVGAGVGSHTGTVPRVAGVWLDLHRIGLIERRIVPTWMSREIYEAATRLPVGPGAKYAVAAEVIRAGRLEEVVSTFAVPGTWSPSAELYLLLGELPPVLDPRSTGPWDLG